MRTSAAVGFVFLLLLASLMASHAVARCGRDCRRTLALERRSCTTACAKGAAGHVCRSGCVEDFRQDEAACRAAVDPAPPDCGETTTTTSTTTTTTTLPRVACAGGTPDQCADGVCPAGGQCGGNLDAATLNVECDCFPAGVTPCGSSSFPQCDGACLGGEVCGEFQQLDAGGQATKLCACVDPAAACTAPAAGNCAVGYCGTQLACSFAPTSPGGPVCGCGQPLP